VTADEFEISPSKIGPSGQRILDRALEESRRRDHPFLTNEHIFLAFAQSEWDLFTEILQDAGLNPNAIVRELEDSLHVTPAYTGRALRVSPATNLVLKLALHHASRAGRQAIEAPDLLAAIFEDSQGIPFSIVRQHGVDPDLLVSKVTARARDMEMREERLKKRFELPPFLKHFAVNLNRMARQDRIAPVFGRDREIQRARGAVSSRARELGDAHRRARCRQDGDCRGARSPHRVLARHAARSAARCANRESADE